VNLFTGMTDREIISAVLMFALFNLFAICVAGSLAAFYISSRPTRGGRVRTGSLLHIVAMLLFMISVVSTVWAAPAEKSFVDNGTMFSGDRFIKVIVGLVFMVLGLLTMLLGAVVTAQQKREAARQSLVSG
jgi:uncharacterized membrane protein